MIRAGVAGLGIANDNAGTEDGDLIENAARFDKHLGFELALLVVVTQLLSDVRLRFEDRAGSQSANVGGRDVKHLSNRGVFAELDKVPGAGHVGAIGLGLFVDFVGYKAETCRIMNDRIAVSSYPLGLLVGKT